MPVPETVRCPHCEDTVLEPPGARVRRCPRCGVTWCAQQALEIILGAPAGHPILALADRPQRRTEAGCPSCGDTYLYAVRPAPADEVVVSYCPACQGVWMDREAVPRLRALVSAAPAPPPALGARPPRDLVAGGAERVAFDDPLVCGLALPIALLFGLVVEAAGPLKLLAWLFVSMPLHELGHASVAWFGCHYALPLPFFTFTVTEERSFFVGMALAALLMAAVLLGARERRRYLFVMGCAGLALQAFMTIFVSNATSIRMFTWSGCGGEILLATLLLVSFHYRLPDSLRWDFFRFVALAIGAVALTHALVFWHGVSQNLNDLPVGSTLGGKDDGNGDMNKLLGWGWSGRGIVRSYLGLGYACLAVVAAHYAVSLRRALRP
jgi:Zn-finger nucleic acid-binding protein